MTDVSQTSTGFLTQNPKLKRLCTLLIFISLAFNVISLIVPFVTVKMILRGSENHTLLSTLHLMWDSKLYFLAVVIVVFSIIFPFFKLSSLFYLLRTKEKTSFHHQLLNIVSFLGKWSFIDVFIVCFILALTNNQFFIDSEPRIGILTFSFAVLMSLIVSMLMEISEENLKPLKKREPQPFVHSRKVSLMLLVSTGIFFGLLFIPFIQIKDWLLLDHSFTIFSFFRSLYNQDAALITILLVIGTILIPFIELLMMWGYWFLKKKGRATERLVSILQYVRNWSLLDVFFISLISFLMEAGKHLMTIETRSSIYLLALMFVFYLIHSYFLKRNIL